MSNRVSMRTKLGWVGIAACSLWLSGCAQHYASVYEIPFKDPKFKACVLNKGITDTSQFSELDCSHYGITSASEITNFQNLETLDLAFNKLQHLDISDNENLKVVSLEGNRLAYLDVSDNDDIKVVNVSNNPLSRLELSRKQNVSYVNIGNTRIKHFRHKGQITTLIVE